MPALHELTVLFPSTASTAGVWMRKCGSSVHWGGQKQMLMGTGIPAWILPEPHHRLGLPNPSSLTSHLPPGLVSTEVLE